MSAFAGSPGDTHSALVHSLTSAAVDGDRERVRRLLTQLLHSRSERVKEQLDSKVQALEHLFHSMRDLAISDELTGIYNRRGFEWAANRMLRHLSRERRGALLVYADVDNLKHINDTLGHVAGDRHLVGAARVLREACGGSAVLGRIGGDEFALLTRHTAAEDYTMLRARIKRAMALANIAAHGPSLSLSLGVAEFDPSRPTTVLALLERADRAMYADKVGAAPARRTRAVVGG